MNGLYIHSGMCGFKLKYILSAINCHIYLSVVFRVMSSNTQKHILTPGDP